MDHLKMHTPNKADENFRKLAELFPNAVTETKNEQGEVVRAIDKDVLMQEINTKVVEGREERYQFTWPDKRKSILLANAPIAKTLRPCREESVNFDTTENLYIEGDNLEVLKLLQETYLGKIKMIYIDPPYNTGNDFVYEDDYSMDNAQFIMQNGGYDEQGNRLFKNMDTNGRFHTDWLNMMYPRLKLARDLLTEDGAIFISIDENEIENLKKVCDEIFGEPNFIGSIIWERAFAPKNDAKYFSDSHDYIVVYARNLIDFKIGKLPRTEEANARYKNPDNDPRGAWTSDNLLRKDVQAPGLYTITTPSGRRCDPPSGTSWRVNQKKYEEMVANNRIWFGNDGKGVPRIKRFLNELQDGMTPTTIWKFQDVGHNQEGRQELKKLFDDKGYFDGPKPVRLLNKILQIANTDKNSIILDFFSGSATTAHAVMQLNAEDGGNRKFIMVQLPEKTDEKSEAYKAGYTNICEIGKERIRRAGAQIIHNSQCIMHNKKCLMTKCPNYESCIINSPLDVGFRVLKCDSSNMKDVYYSPESYNGTFLKSLTENIKEARSPEDLLFQVMLDLGILLSSKITETVIGGKKVFDVADGFLIACFDDTVTDEVVTEIAKKKPQYFVMRDSSLAKDSVATNFDQIFALYSPYTTRKVL